MEPIPSTTDLSTSAAVSPGSTCSPADSSTTPTTLSSGIGPSTRPKLSLTMAHHQAKVDTTATTTTPREVDTSTSSLDSSPSTTAVDTTLTTSAVDTAKRPRVSLSMFEKSRFGGTHMTAAKPNVNVQRKPSKSPQAPSPPATSTSFSVPQPSQAVQRRIQPPTSFFLPPATETTAEDAMDLPLLWPQTMPQQDRKWVAEALFHTNVKGKLELKDNLKLWYHPPPTNVVYHQAPTPDRFFAHRLLVWMPYRLWKVRLQCTKPTCAGHQLCSGGLHRRVRQVLDIDNFYNMVTETLICTKCRSSYLSWGHTVLQQLDLAHRSEFRIIITRKYACDIRVMRLLRERTLGNGPVRLQGQLLENHSEEWLQRVSRYTSECMAFLNKPGLQQVVFQEPPPILPVPSYKWLLTAYSKDILSRLDEVKAAITSTYGSILKMDSTKKVTKKLSGPGKGTAQWMTSVGNEIGQVLISVLTADEGGGIDAMAAGLVERYRRAGVAPPTLLYVDCHCCKEAGDTKLKQRFSGWPDVIVRLDIWHFIRRLAGGVTTDAHQLYPIFMARLSACIFEWHAGDLAELRRAKRVQLTAEGWPALTDAEVDKRLTKTELALHCRRRTRGTEMTISLLDMLIGELSGDKGKDAMGVPLFDTVRMNSLWRVQKRHVSCLQDPPNVQLYTETGTVTKGGIALKTYRCARGSTSLESFHCHLNRFIPGNSANSLNFQIYLLEGLFRWNKDRAAAALAASENSGLRTYTGELVHTVNTNYEALFGRKLVPGFSPPAAYTGELIGVQYLLRQSKQPLEDMTPGSDRTEELLEDINMEQQVEEDEGFVDTLGEEAIVEHIVDPDAPLPATQLPAVPPQVGTPSAQYEPASVQLPAAQPHTALVPSAPVLMPAAQLPSAQGIPPAPVLPAAQLPSAQGAPAPVLPAAQLPPVWPPAAQLPSTQGTPVLPATQLPPVWPPATQLPSAQGAPAPVLPAAQLPSAQGAPAPVLPPVLLPAAQLPSAQGATALPAAQPHSATPVLPATPPPCGPLLGAQGPHDPVSSGMAVGGHGIPGLDKVDELAEYLVELRSQTRLVLSHQQEETIIGLWENLEQFDKDRVRYAARYQDRLTTGSFRSPKKKAVFTPGVESTKRCVLGSSGSPAQWPNCCRLVEMIFIRLCQIHRSPRKQGTVSHSRWDLILRDYRHIRQLILSNAEVMQHTTLQLVEVNQRTLITWHNQRFKDQEVSVLLQGLTLPVARPVTNETLPPPRVQPVAPPQHIHQHLYNMPPNTAGQAKTKFRKIQPSASATSATPATSDSSAPKAQERPRLLLPKPAPVGSQFSVPAGLMLSINPNPLATSPIPPPPAESKTKRTYNRTVTTNLCRKCGQCRTVDTGHSQYKGKIYCPNTESISKEEWLKRMRQL